MLLYEFRINIYLNLSSDKTKTSKVCQLHYKFLYDNSLRAVLIACEYIKALRRNGTVPKTIKIFGTSNLKSRALYYLIGGNVWWRHQLAVQACHLKYVD